MIRRLSILHLLSSILLGGSLLSSWAADRPTVVFRLESFTGRVVNYPLTLTPYAPLAVDSTNLITATTWQLTPSNGIACASNILAGDYTLTIPQTGAKVILTVPATNALLDAASLVSIAPAAAAGLAYSKTASDARYLRASAGVTNLDNVAFTNAAETIFYGTLTSRSNLAVGQYNQFSVDGAGNVDAQYVTAPVIDSAQFRGSFFGDGAGLTNVSGLGGSSSNLVAQQSPALNPAWSRPAPATPYFVSPWQTPPMGWNSWNRYQCPDEALWTNTLNAMVSLGLRDAGYTVVCFDAPWQEGRDAFGYPLLATNRFPSGMKYLRDYALDRGFQFGMWTPASDYTNNIGYPGCTTNWQGAGGYAAQDAHFFATNHVTYLKLDNFWSANFHTRLSEIIAAMESHVATNGRPVHYMTIGYGYWTDFMATNTHSMRVATDITTNWTDIIKQMDRFEEAAAYMQPGGTYPDMDMLEIGNLTDAEETQSHFCAWVVQGSPLMLGCGITNMPTLARQLATNALMLRINQDPGNYPGRLVSKTRTSDGGDTRVYMKPIGHPGSGTNVLYLLNNSATTTLIPVSISKLGLGTNVNIKRITPSAAVVDYGIVGDYFAPKTFFPHQCAVYWCVGDPMTNVVISRYSDVLTNNSKYVTLSGTFAGNGSGLTNLISATNAVTGFLAQSNSYHGAFEGNGVALTNFSRQSLANIGVTTNNAADVTFRGLSVNQGSTNILSAPNDSPGLITAGGAWTFRDVGGNGGSLTNLNASALASGTVPALSFQSISNKPSLRIAIMGDSLSNEGNALYCAWAKIIRTNSALNGITIATNASIGGENTTNMLARFDAEFSGFAPTNTGLPTAFVLWGGANDLKSPAETTWENISNIWLKARSAGYSVIAFTVMPQSSMTAAKRRTQELLNNYIRSEATNCVRLVDVAALFGDATATNIFYDGVHLTPAANYRLAHHFEWLLTQGNGWGAGPGWTDRVANDNGIATNLLIVGGQVTGTLIGSNGYQPAVLGLYAAAEGGGFAAGNTAIASYLGVAIGDNTTAISNGVAVGRQATGYDRGAAVGWLANGTNRGAAMGYQARAYDLAAAVGDGALGYTRGAAVGSAANGHTYGASLGRQATSYSYGAAVGNLSSGTNQGAALGYLAVGDGIRNAAIGSTATIPAGWSNTVALGPGTASLSGGLSFRGMPLMSSDGTLYAGSAEITNTVTAANFVATATATTTPSFKAAGTNAMVLVAPDGGTWLLRVATDGTLSTVTNSAGL